MRFAVLTMPVIIGLLREAANEMFDRITFDQAIEMLQREFDFDDEMLEHLKDDLLFSHLTAHCNRTVRSGRIAERIRSSGWGRSSLASWSVERKSARCETGRLSH